MSLLRACTRVLLLVFCPWSAGHLAAQWRTPEHRNFHNSTYVGPESEEARRLLFAAEERELAGDPEEAVRELVRLLRLPGGETVSYGERLVLSVRRAAALRLLQFPEDLRRSSCTEDPEALRRILRDPDSDTALWVDLIAQHPLCATGETLLARLGERELLRGHGDLAAGWLDQLIHWPSGHPGIHRGVGAARLREAMLRLGEEVPDGVLWHWPDMQVRVGDRQMAVGDFQVPRRDLHASDDWPVPGGDGANALLARQGWGPIRPLFVAAQPPDPAARNYLPRRFLDQELADDVPLVTTRLPLVHQGRVISLERDGVHVRSLETGEDCFAPIAFDYDLHVDPSLYTVQHEASSLLVVGHRLYVTLRLVQDSGFLPDDALGALFAMDLSRECYVDFAVRVFDPTVEESLQGITFSGPPVMAGGSLFLVGSRLDGSETECRLFQFDPVTGALRGERFLARAGAVPRFADRFARESERRLVTASPLVTRHGVLYACTNLGVVAAIRAADLGLEWLYRYNRRMPQDSRRYTREAFHWSGPWPVRPPVALTDRVLVSPTDSRYLYSLARWPNPEGDLLLNDPVEKLQRRAWVGATEDQLLFLTDNFGDLAVQATDHWGAELWETPLPSAEAVTGRPVQVDGALYVPTGLSIYRIRLDRPTAIERRLAPPPQVAAPFPEVVFGDLQATDRYLFSLSDTYLCAWQVDD